MRIIQHIPSFFEGWVAQEAEVNDWPELIALPWIEQTITLPKWHRWSLHRNYGAQHNLHLLLAEFDHGNKWYVIAKIDATPEELKTLAILPEFDPEQAL